MNLSSRFSASTESIIDELPLPHEKEKGWPWTEGCAILPETAPDSTPWPKISIITPSFNQGDFLEETVRSVLLQAYPNLEYIVIDGGSTDQSVDVIHQYEPWLAYWTSEPDNGQADAIEKGFSRATGSIISWLNSDDTFEPNAIATAVKHLVANPQVGAVYSDCHYVDLSSQRCGLYRADDYSIERQYFVRNGIPQPTVFMRSDAYHRCGGIDQRYRYILDFELWLRFTEAAPMVRMPGTLANYRLWSDSHTVARPEHFLNEKLALFEQLAAEPGASPEERELALKATVATRLLLARSFAESQQWTDAFEQLDMARSILPSSKWDRSSRELAGSLLARRGQSRLREGNPFRGLTDIIHGSIMSPKLVGPKLGGIWTKKAVRDKNHISTDQRA